MTNQRMWRVPNVLRCHPHNFDHMCVTIIYLVFLINFLFFFPNQNLLREEIL